ncbi:MAG TPA: aldehyde dehydrogenase (NADP(+)), partial [Vicinamibacterales bacterium]|nr:aldehyde dehydrogenase (NADP(+)) [Vicinamibacterales bacterium]
AAIAEGSYVEAVISPADPAAQPVPRPDLRRMLVPIGPVAVFTPSNFPLAFGVAGTDTASALAAGCPAIVKGHPSHPGTSEACGRAVAAAVREVGAPPGVFSLLQGRTPAVARALVEAPEIAAVAFTGSQAAGRALHDAAAARPRPIPVYAEMGSLNPVFIGPVAQARRGETIADGLAGSVTMGVGQFCTKPGLVFVPGEREGRAFAERLAALVAARPLGAMLNAALRAGFDRAVERTLSVAGVERLGPAPSVSGDVPVATVATTTARVFERTPALREEHFGPFTLVVRCADADEAVAIARGLDGQLAAAIHAEPEDHAWAERVAAVLADRVGRIVWNGYPTGVAVAWATHHGGPYPATTWPAHTSVGPLALRRFLRPVAYQNVPDALLPPALRDANPLGLQRLVDGRWTREPMARPGTS